LKTLILSSAIFAACTVTSYAQGEKVQGGSSVSVGKTEGGNSAPSAGPNVGGGKQNGGNPSSVGQASTLGGNSGSTSQAQPKAVANPSGPGDLGGGVSDGGGGLVNPDAQNSEGIASEEAESDQTRSPFDALQSYVMPMDFVADNFLIEPLDHSMPQGGPPPSNRCSTAAAGCSGKAPVPAVNFDRLCIVRWRNGKVLHYYIPANTRDSFTVASGDRQICFRIFPFIANRPQR
jgi:hypothetical protein